MVCDNFLEIVSNFYQSLHMISWHLDMFHDFFDFVCVLYNFKTMDCKFSTMFREHGTRKL
jgi:hypothetical protein